MTDWGDLVLAAISFTLFYIVGFIFTSRWKRK